jgi:hypothetical protein
MYVGYLIFIDQDNVKQSESNRGSIEAKVPTVLLEVSDSFNGSK